MWHWWCSRIQSYFQGSRERRRPSCYSCTLQPFGALLPYDELQYDCQSLLGPQVERWIPGWCYCQGSQWRSSDSGLYGDKRGGVTISHLWQNCRIKLDVWQIGVHVIIMHDQETNVWTTSFPDSWYLTEKRLLWLRLHQKLKQFQAVPLNMYLLECYLLPQIVLKNQTANA